MKKQEGPLRYKLKKFSFILALLITYNLQFTTYSNADTVYTKDHKELKGIIIEDYKDRIVFSTADGEQTIMKEDVMELYYDTEEQNLIKLAEQARDRGDFIKSFVYYDKAFKLDPSSRQAKDGIVFLQGYLFKKDMAQKEEVIRRHNELEQTGANPEVVVKSEEEKFKDSLKKLRETAGISLEPEGGITRIENVRIGSPAYEAGIRNGDVLIAIWGRLVGYMTLREVVETILEKTSLETKCTIERAVDVKGTTDIMGTDLKMQFEGLTVSAVRENGPASEAGIKKGDIITEINGNSTRYMPLNRAIELIRKSKGDIVNLILQREVVMWGKEGG